MKSMGKINFLIEKCEFFYAKIVNGEKMCTIEPPFDGEFMAPICFSAPVKKGYNILMLKVCEGFTPLQYRKAWGARVTVYKEGTHA